MIENTTILPKEQKFARIASKHELHLEAICVFVATGFFMGDDSYWKDEVCLLPARDYVFDDDGYVQSSSSNFEWYYATEERSFSDVLEEYIALLTQIIQEQVGQHPVILPLSGGLDSRSQAMVLQGLENPVKAYSYAFEGGYPEQHIAKQIAAVCGFDFKSFVVPKGYLWGCIDELASINGCYSEFTHPRQMAVLPQLKSMSGVFSLGHWGDVLFDRGAPRALKESDVVPFLLKKMVKPTGLELAETLWRTWGLEGDFKTYLISRIETALSDIQIDDLSAKIRAFKTSQWAHRWTTTNLSVFEAAGPITLPYYDDRMLEFICRVPEAYLADRQLQIAHIRQDPKLAAITWHAQKPYNLYNFSRNKVPYNLPYRFASKLQRTGQALLGKPYIQRNWELQFVGDDNDAQLQSYLFEPKFQDWIPESIVRDMYSKFQTVDPVQYAHAVSVLLTLSVWHQQHSVSK